MKIGVPKERAEGEKRVALTPESVKSLTAKDHTILIEKGAGEKAMYKDDEYKNNGAEIVDDVAKIHSESDIILKVAPPTEINGKNEIDSFKEGVHFFSMQDIINKKDNLEHFKKKKINAFSMEFIPRITLAQSMDVLSSMATVAGYKSVLLATDEFQKFFPMFMTAAGTIPPAKVLVLGAGVAGLQAIATAKRLGAVVEAFDLRPVVKEQVESLGAKFVEMEITEDMQDEQGYAKMASPEFIKKEMELIDAHLSKSDICITTAQVFGKKAPTLIKDYMVKNMKPGSVIVDLAVEQGGNCELAKPGEVVEVDGVKVIGPVNLPSTMAHHASRMYSKNMENLLNHLIKENELHFSEEDEIATRTRLTRDGELVSEIVQKILNG